MNSFQSLWYRLFVLLSFGNLILVWYGLGPDRPIFLLAVSGFTWVLGPTIPPGFLPHHWFRVPPEERLLHRMLGVGIFHWLLDQSGWNRHIVDPLRRFSGTRAGLPALEHSIRAGAGSHGICFVIHMVVSATVFFAGHWWSALWVLLAGVPIHFYPLLLQRSLMLRLQPLLDKTVD